MSSKHNPSPQIIHLWCYRETTSEEHAEVKKPTLGTFSPNDIWKRAQRVSNQLPELPTKWVSTVKHVDNFSRR